MGCGSSATALPRKNSQNSVHEKATSAPASTPVDKKENSAQMPIEAPTPASTPTSPIEVKDEEIPVRMVPKSESKREEKMKRLSQSGIARSFGPRLSADFLQQRRSTLRRAPTKDLKKEKEQASHASMEVKGEVALIEEVKTDVAEGAENKLESGKDAVNSVKAIIEEDLEEEVEGASGEISEEEVEGGPQQNSKEEVEGGPQQKSEEEIEGASPEREEVVQLEEQIEGGSQQESEEEVEATSPGKEDVSQQESEEEVTASPEIEGAQSDSQKESESEEEVEAASPERED